MKKVVYYFSFLLVCSCNCDSGQSTVSDGPKTYEVTMPDGKKKTVTTQSAEERKAIAEGPQTRNPQEVKEGMLLGMTEEQRKEFEKGDHSKKVVDYVEQKPRPDIGTKTSLNNTLPVACELIDTDWLRTQMSAPEDILTTNSSSKKNPNVSSCFFRWDNGIIANCGIFLQLIENPVPEEVENYAMHFINGKLTGGEMDLEGNNYAYSKYSTVGSNGAYSAEQGKYFWQISPERVFMLAFNTGLSKNTEKNHADAIAKKVMKAYSKVQ